VVAGVPGSVVGKDVICVGGEVGVTVGETVLVRVAVTVGFTVPEALVTWNFP